jgi:hypothetical protein
MPSRDPETQASSDIPREAVLAALDRILASEALGRAKRPAKFLRHLVGPASKMKTAMATYTPNIPWAEVNAENIVDMGREGHAKLARNLARRIKKVLHRRQTYGNSDVYSTLLRFSERFSVWFLHFLHLFDVVLGMVWRMAGRFCAALTGRSSGSKNANSPHLPPPEGQIRLARQSLAGIRKERGVPLGLMTDQSCKGRHVAPQARDVT